MTRHQQEASSHDGDLDAVGNAWVGVAVNSTIAPSSGTAPVLVELNPAGSAVVASAVQAGLGNVAALAFDADSNVYIAGSYTAKLQPFQPLRERSNPPRNRQLRSCPIRPRPAAAWTLS